MPAGLKRILGPAIEPITRAEAKRHCRMDTDITDEDTDVDVWIQAAREWCEDFTGRAMIDQTWELWLPAFPCGAIYLPKPPLIDVVSIYYINTSGDLTLLAADQYDVDSSFEPEPRIVPSWGNGWPGTRVEPGAVRVRFRAGYADRTGSPTEGTDRVPAALRQAMKLVIGHINEHRESVVDGQAPSEVPQGAEWVARRYRVEGLG